MISSLFKYLCILFVVSCIACTPSSEEDFREAGRSINRSIIQELQAIHSHDELAEKLPTLEKLFNRLADVMIAARKFEEKRKGSSNLPFTVEDQKISDQLRVELNLVFRIPGGKELIEKAQQQALDKLDRFEQSQHRS